MLFDTVEVYAGEEKKPIVLQTRFMRSATSEGIGDPDGSLTPALAAEMEKLAVHHVGLIVFSYFFTEECGRAAKFQLSMATDAAAESYPLLLIKFMNLEAIVLHKFVMLVFQELLRRWDHLKTKQKVYVR